MKTGDWSYKSGARAGWVPAEVVLLVTCEHASAHVPRRLRHCFAGAPARRDLTSHRGSDIGAARVARQLARSAGVPCIEGGVTRLLIDLNRSPQHRQLFSKYSRALSAAQKQWLLDTYYWPHRARVMKRVEDTRRSCALAVHIAIHSFTPVLDGAVRSADVGLLYDPRRPVELKFARALQRCLSAGDALRVRRNYPYRGVSDGLPTLLRQRFSGEDYLGLELELNQALLASCSKEFVSQLFECLRQALHTLG